MLDILLIDLLGKLDFKAVRQTAKQVFGDRATHGFPPAIAIPTAWHGELEVTAMEPGYPAISGTEIVAKLQAFIDRVSQTD